MAIILRPLTWAQFKAICIATKYLNLQYETLADSYRVLGPDANDITWEILVPFVIPDPDNPGQTITNPDATDFTTNIQAACNMPLGVRAAPFAAMNVRFSGDAVSTTISGSGATTIDFFIDPSLYPTGVYTDGADAFVVGSAQGDYITAQVVDVYNILGYGANTIIAQYINKWYINPYGVMDVKTNYASMLPPGLVLRVIYTSVGNSSVWAAINHYLHVPLVTIAASGS